MTTSQHRSKKRPQQQEDQCSSSHGSSSSSSSSSLSSTGAHDDEAAPSLDAKLQPLPDTPAEGNRLRKMQRRDSANTAASSSPPGTSANNTASSSSSSRGSKQQQLLTSNSSMSGGGTSVSDHDTDDDDRTTLKPAAAAAAAAAVSAASSSVSVVVPKEEDSSDQLVDDHDVVNGSSSNTSSAKLPSNDKEDCTTTSSSSTNNNKDTTNKDPTTSRDYYFDSYAHHAIHEEMLKDEVRTKTYEMAIRQNGHLFQDKVVLDVGCGTGILSMFAAQAGAKHVYAVDCSTILQQARQIVERNGFADKITCIQGKIEEIELPVDKVDIIVSEWMGYFLLYESMLDTVIYARDKWLVPGGVVFPDKAVMYLTAMEDGNVKRERIDFWNDVYGFDMTPIQEIALREPVVDVVDAKALVTDSVPILRLDILTCTKADLEFTSKFRLQAQRNDYLHGLVAYFECAFTQIHKPIGFSTAPFARYTHWKQTMFYLADAVTICAGETLEGEITCKPNERNRRDLDISVQLNFNGRHSQIKDKTMLYRLR